MKFTLGDKLGAGLDKLRLQLPARQEEAPKPQVGLVVPDPVPHESVRIPLKDIVTLPQTDEGQVVGELLDWLFLKGYFRKSVTRTSLLVAQRDFFKERDQ